MPRNDSLEKKHNEQFQQVFAVLKAMIAEDEIPQSPIGCHTEARGKKIHEKVSSKKKK